MRGNTATLGKESRVQIRHMIALFLTIISFQVVVLVWLAVDLSSLNQSSSDAEKQHYQGLQWAQRLKQSSDDLTRMTQSRTGTQ